MTNIDEIFKVGNTAVITGASSGIGRTSAIECAQKGMNVWLLDKDIDELIKVREYIKSKMVDIYPHQVIKEVVADVSQEESMVTAANTVFADPSTTSVHFLMNNAAMSIGGDAINTSMDDFDTMMKTNLYGCIHSCKYFVPIMKEKNEPGIIVNTGSKQGITTPPGNLTYNVTKSALKTWTEGLEHDLMMDRFQNGGKLRVALLVPGWTNTSIKLKEMRDRAKVEGSETFDYDAMKAIISNEENPADGAWMPKQVFDYMMKELKEGSFYIICPDNEVDSKTDKIRMTWAMQDVTESRPPLSRWHPEWKLKFEKYKISQTKLN